MAQNREVQQNKIKPNSETRSIPICWPIRLWTLCVGSIQELFPNCFWRDKTRSLYENAIEACYLLNDPEKAFYFFEKSRAVLLNDQLNELGRK